MLKHEPLLARPQWQPTETLDEAWAHAWQMPHLNEDSLAFLQYTSGSIGTPKGVMVTHGNMLENQRLITASFRQSQSIVCVGWLPLHHDMGLIGNLLHPIYHGGHFVFMSPVAFVQQPIRWLRAITKYRGTLGRRAQLRLRPVCVRHSPQQRAELDLSSWEVAYTGAERVQDRTLREFRGRFRPVSFHA